MADYPEKLDEILEDFSGIADRTERADLLIHYGDQFHPVPEEIAQRPFPEEHRVPSCESEAYVWARPYPDGTLKFYFAVENPQGLSAKALAHILGETLSGVPLKQVEAVSPEIVFTLFGNDLSMGKGAGLTGMVSMVQNFAREHVMKQPT
jgi:cysteine desulfuration protein SufE